jgi:hypothetical protein
LKLFRQHEIFGTVQTIWYFLSAHVNILPLWNLRWKFD